MGILSVKDRPKISLFLVLVLLLQLILPIAGNLVYADDGDGDLGSGIFKSVKIEIDGTEVSSDATIEIDDNTEIILIFEWKLEDGLILQENDWAQIELPDAFKNVNDGGTLVANIDGTDIEVGTYEFTGEGYLKVVFNDVLVERSENRNGEVGFLMKFNLDEFEGDAKQLIKFEEFGTEFTITAKPSGEGIEDIIKSGKLDKDINPEYIDWIIDVNTTLEDLINAKVSDTIPEGLELVEGSVEIYKLKVGLNGGESIVEDGKVTTKTINTTSDGFEVILGDTNGAYRIKYRTKIVGEYTNDGYTNKAVLSSDNERDKDIEFPIEPIEKQSLIEKDGWEVGAVDGKNPTKITWQIDINKAQQNLANVVVQDNLPQELTLSEVGIEIYELNPSGTDWSQGDKVTTIDVAEGFPLNFGNINGQAYRIVVETDIDYGDTYYKNITFENTATIEYDDSQEESDDAEVTVYRDTLIEKSGRDTTNYGGPEITWTIDVNKANHSIENATITDTIGEGLKLREGSIEVDGKLVTNTDKPGEYPYLKEQEDNKFILILGDISSSSTITYITDIIYPEMLSFENDVELKGDDLKGDGIGVGEDEGTITDKVPDFEPDVENIYSKGKAPNTTIGGITYYNTPNYEDKTMSWVTTIDAIKEEITALTLTDTFVPAGSMVFLKNTLRVVKGSKILVEKTEDDDEDWDYELTDNGAGGFVLEFKGPLVRAEYKIYYKTSFDPDLILGKDGQLNTSERYTNQVNFNGTTEYLGEEREININKSAYYDIKDTIFKGGKKEGSLDRNNRTITWKLYVNALGQTLEDSSYVVKDQLSKGQVLGEDFDADSFTIYEYSLNSNGTFNVEEEPVTGLNLSYQKDEDGEGFTLTFESGIDNPYLIVYKTQIVGISEKEYKNEVTTFIGEELDKDYSTKVPYENHNKFVNKDSENIEGNKAYTDDIINWKVSLNESLSEIEGARFEDLISIGQVYIEDSIKLYKDFVDEESLVEIEEGKLDVSIIEEEGEDKGKTKITLELGDIDSIYIVTYDTVVIAKEGLITNSSSLWGEEEQLGSSSEKSYSSSQASWGTGSGDLPRGEIVITKVDEETGEIIANNSAQFELYYMLNGEERVVNDETNSTIVGGADGGKTGWGNLPYRTYYLREKESPIGYEKFTIAPEGYQLNDDGDIIIEVSKAHKEIRFNIPNTKIKTEVTATKEWINGPKNNRPEVQLELYRQIGDSDPVKVDNSLITLNGTEEPAWTYTWENLDLTDINGTEYEYSVLEVDVPENYKVSYGVDDEGEVLVVTNSYIIPTNGTAKATKNWVKGDKLEKPTIWFKLYRSIEEGEREEVPNVSIQKLADGTTEVTWTNLEETDIDGNSYDFYVIEVDGEGNAFEPDNYIKAEVGLEVTNTYESPKINIDVKKIWENGPKPSIQLQLFRQTIEYQPGVTEPTLGELEEVEDTLITLDGTEEIPWTHTWTVDKTDEDGLDYLYTVVEVKIGDIEVGNAAEEDIVNNYTREVIEEKSREFTVTNTYVIPKTDITVKKDWIGGKERPEIEIQLYRQIEDGELEEVEDALVILDGTEEVPWTYTWEGLDKTDIDGNEYIYTAKEVGDIENYNPNYDQGEDGSLLVTNTYESPKATFTATKTWIGGPKDKPTIELQLFRNGDAFGKPVKLANGQTTYTWEVDWTDENGVEYVYTVDEVNIPKGYAKYVEEDGRTIYNVHKDIVGEDKDGKELTKEEFEKIFDPDEPVGPGGLPKTGFNDLMFTLFLIEGLFILSLGVVLYKKFS